MAEENKYIQKLITARDRQIEDRRNSAAALTEKYTRGHTEDMREAFVKIQDTIEAIERAIAHEEFIASEWSRSSWPMAIGFRSVER
jgi:hypothetical protein